MMVIRSSAIWVSVVVMLAFIVGPAYFRGKAISGGTVISALMVLALGQAAQAVTLYLWTLRDARKVVWDPENRILTSFGFRVSQKFWTFGKVKAEFSLPLNEIQEVTFEPGRVSQLKFKTNQGFLLLTSDLDGFVQLKDLMLDAVQNQSVQEARSGNSSAV